MRGASSDQNRPGLGGKSAVIHLALEPRQGGVYYLMYSMQTARQSTIEPGAMIAGKYRVHRMLAEGGMGMIMEAEHVALGQRVAVKLLLPEMESRPEIIQRFLREARAAARLRSDHVVRVFDIGTDDRGLPFMVMELLSGVDIASEIETRGSLPFGEAVSYILEALDAIVEAHAAGIVHRDLKPANLFLSGSAGGTRRVRVLDFGISKFTDVIDGMPDASITSSQSMLGSPAYMSPEQVRSTKGVDARTDVWALGVILYEMLTGVSAFDGDSLGDIFAKIREEDVPPLRNRCPDVPEELAAIVHACLVRDREKRMPDATTLRDRLRPFASRESQVGIVAAAPTANGKLASAPSSRNQMVTAPLSDPKILGDARSSDSRFVPAAPLSEREIVERAQTIAATGDVDARTPSGRWSMRLLLGGLVVLMAGGIAAGVFVVVKRAPLNNALATTSTSTTTAPTTAISTAISTSPTTSISTSTTTTTSPAPATSTSTPSPIAGLEATAASRRPLLAVRSAAPVASSHATMLAPAAPTASVAPKQKDDLGL
jgi:serine/threonine protein kinase